LLKLGPLPINTFGVMLVLAFLTGTWYITRDAQRQGLDPEQIQTLCWWVLGAIVLGGRVMFIITSPQPYLENPLRIFAIWEGGLVYYGGFLATVGTVVYFAWRDGLHIWKLTDLFTVGGMLGLAIGRWGCFFAGDDHGRVIPGATDADHPFWALKFSRDVPYLGLFDGQANHVTHPAMEPQWMDQWLYPSQWMMSLKAFTLFVLLAFLAKRKKFDGQLTAVLLMGYAVLRSIIELFRGDMDRGVYFQGERVMRAYLLGKAEYPGFYLTTSQAISIALFALGLILYLVRKDKGVAKITPYKKASAAEAEPVPSKTRAKRA
jgi:phosphatidylglycerol:prolipoprotein diacylglycerol transferase